MSEISLTCVGDVLTLEIDEKVVKCKIPKGERGAQGRDGISIRGEKGEKGEPGLAGRDSLVPGPKGEKGDVGEMGRPGMTPEISIGTVVAGETPQVILSGTHEKPILNFVLPRGERGEKGGQGRDGKHGTHEYIQLQYAGNNPRFNNDFLASYVIADGLVELPEMNESDIGKWTHIKTFDKVTVTGLVEGGVNLDRDSARFVVIAYGNTFKFSKF